MNKRELVKKLAKRVDASQRDTAKIVDALCELVGEELVQGETIKMNGFGNFQLRRRANRKGRNPLTGEQIEIPATNVVVFNPSGRLAESVASAGKTVE